MAKRLRDKWRPSLALVLGGGLLGTLLLSLIGLVALRYLGPEIGFRNAAVLLACLILLATSFLGWLLVRLLLTPIRSLQEYAARMRLRPQEEIEPPGRSGTKELHLMAQNVIDMADHLRNREVTIRSFTDHVSHEIKTPVSAIRAAAELIDDNKTLPAEDSQLLQQILGATQQIENQLSALRAIARAREMRHQGTTLLADHIDELRNSFSDLEIHLSEAQRPIPLSREGLSILLTHLLMNASEHGAKHVEVTVTKGQSSLDLIVSDDGCGISPGNAAQVFDPFFTTKRDRGGTGMGLAIVRNMLGVHGAKISLQPSDDGARFLIRFGQ